MRPLPHAPSDPDFLAVEHAKRASRFASRLEATPQRNVWDKGHAYFAELVLGSYVFEDDATLARHHRAYAEVAAAHLALVAAQGAPLRVTVGGQTYDATFGDARHHVHPTAWLDAWAAALLADDASLLDLVLSASSDGLRRAGLSVGAHQLATVDFVRSVQAGARARGSACSRRCNRSPPSRRRGWSRSRRSGCGGRSSTCGARS